MQLSSAKPGTALGDPAKVFDFVPFPGAVGGDVDLYVEPSQFRAVLAADESKHGAAVRAAAQRPLAASALEAKSAAPAWKAIPSWAVIGTKDRAIPPAEQVVMARRAHAQITKIRAAHLSMVSRPSVVTKVIRRATAATD